MNRRNFLKRLLAIPAAYVGLKVVEKTQAELNEEAAFKRPSIKIPYTESQEFQSAEWKENHRKAYLERREAIERDLLFGIKERDKQSDDFWNMFT